MNNELATRRRWFVVTLASCAAAVPLLLWWGRGRWFFLDEWVFLSQRSLSSPSSWFDGHNGHWVTAPALEHLLLYEIFGLRSYLPYQLMSVLMHVAVVLVGWCVMVRLGVRPLIASLVALAFLPFGSGATNILWGFQVSVTGALVFGLLHLLLADHAGSWNRRDAAGLVCGIAGLMCSAQSVSLVAGVGIAVLLRRGWRTAASHVLPLAAIYGAWLVLARRDAEPLSMTFEVLHFVWTMVSSSAAGVGGSRAAGLLIALLVAVGVASMAADGDRSTLRERLAVPAALLVASVGVAFSTALARAAEFGAGLGSADRYVYVVVALLLPLVAVGCEALARRWRAAGVLAAALLLAGVPNNVRLLADHPPWGGAARNLYETAASSPLLADAPPDTVVLAPSMFPGYGPTVGLLLDASNSGRIRRPAHVDPAEALLVEMALGLEQGPSDGSQPCAAALPVSARLQPGDRVVFDGDIAIEGARDGVTQERSFRSDEGGVVSVTAHDLPVTIRADGTQPAALACVLPVG